jgi:preprotein translocase subunit SecF
MSAKLATPKTRFNFDFIGNKWIGFAVTGLLVIATIYSLTTKGLNFGIDFTGGIVIEGRTETNAKLDKMRGIFANGEFGEVSLQAFADPRDVMIRVQAADDDSQQKKVEAIKAKLDSEYGEKIEYRKVDYVGPQVGGELIRGSIIAVGLSLLAMLGYLWLRFEWQYGVGGIIALFHDALLTIGFYSISGLEFNLTSVAAILTIVGYSINDSVVIYDRIRENFRKFKSIELAHVINLSVNETLLRTFMTGGTVLLAAGALVVFGGDVLFGFASAMLFGVLIGTYSSIYISATILIFFNLKR